jgi:hypothetical protein
MYHQMTTTNNKAVTLGASTNSTGNLGTNYLMQDNQVEYKQEYMAIKNDHHLQLQSHAGTGVGWQHLPKSPALSSPVQEKAVGSQYHHQQQQQQNQHQYQNSTSRRTRFRLIDIEKEAHNTVFVGNLTEQTSKSELRNIFSQFGKL